MSMTKLNVLRIATPLWFEQAFQEEEGWSLAQRTAVKQTADVGYSVEFGELKIAGPDGPRVTVAVGVTSTSAALALGRNVDDVLRDSAEWHIRKRIGQLIKPSRDLFWTLSNEDLDDGLGAVVVATQEIVLPYLRRFTSGMAILRELAAKDHLSLPEAAVVAHLSREYGDERTGERAASALEAYAQDEYVGDEAREYQRRLS